MQIVFLNVQISNLLLLNEFMKRWTLLKVFAMASWNVDVVTINGFFPLSVPGREVRAVWRERWMYWGQGGAGVDLRPREPPRLS